MGDKMDFRSEFEEYKQNSAQLPKVLDNEVHSLHREIELLDAKIMLIQEKIQPSIDKQQKNTQALLVKEKTLAELKRTLNEHETALKANELILRLHKDITKNHKNIDASLTELQHQKTSAEQEIVLLLQNQQNAAQNPEYAAQLRIELEENKANLLSIIQKIDKIQSTEQKHFSIVKFFIQLLRSWGWRSNPTADEHKKLQELEKEIASISFALNGFDEYDNAVAPLQEKKDQLLREEEDLKEVKATQAAVQESQQIIPQLKSQIKAINKSCQTLRTQTHDKKLDQAIAQQKQLEKEKTDKTKELAEKTSHLAKILDPKHIERTEKFLTALTNAAMHRETYLQRKEQRIQQHSNTFFARDIRQEINNNNIANDHALIKINNAIQIFMNDLDRGDKEYQTLRDITSVIVQLQILNTQNMDLPPQARNLTGIQTFQTRINHLIEELPLDNPLKAAQHYIQELTQPAEGDKLKADKNHSPQSGAKKRQ